MKKIFLFIVLSMFITQGFSQAVPLPDGNFEQGWVSYPDPHHQGGTYIDYRTAVLGTLNGLYELYDNAPFTTQRETSNPHGGSYALKLRSDLFELMQDQQIFIPGVIGTLDENFMAQYVDNGGITTHKMFDFEEKPLAISGYYRYSPVSGDSAAIDVALYTNCTDEDEGTQIAAGFMLQNNAVADWTSFYIPLTYSNTTAQPDGIKLLFVASAGYDFTQLENCAGQIGSILWIDDVYLNYATGIKEPITPVVKTSVYPNPAVNEIKFNFDQEVDAKLVVYSITGAVVFEKNINEAVYTYNTSDLRSGQYVFRLIDGNTILSKGNFVISK